MRSLYIPGLRDLMKEGDGILTLEGKGAHHLLKVVRINLGENVLLLDGQGLKYLTQIVEIGKKYLKVQVREITQANPNLNWDLAIGVVKKEALESIFKLAVELGINNLFLLRTRYSSSQIPGQERIQGLIESALIQSNNPFFLQVQGPMELGQLNFGEYDHIFYFASKKLSREYDPGAAKGPGRILIMIGPEGGLSPEEEEWLGQVEGIRFTHLPTYILRSPNAVAAAAGFILGLFNSFDRPKKL